MSQQQQGNEPHRWRAVIRDVDPEAVYRSVRAVNGFRSWEDPPRTLYQVATTTLEVVHDNGTCALLINGTTAERVRDTATRLGYPHEAVELRSVPELAGLPELVRQARKRKEGAA
ncbi:MULTISPECIES: hypothetical protein [Actinopolyspora]|uniref:Uncharacterized protein n=1 Tax=Actinopolyspora saharensis TaxID=995062 RepID=A0A1H0YH39_9ACTN|nr:MULTISPECIES: hypothetical protein [Actinopolyspora]SDQ14527.1 hypothetical protein SAMN04489718_0456 [Actinopolyspora saharensis]